MGTSAATGRASLLRMTLLCLFGTQAWTEAQMAGVPQTIPGNGYRIAGTVVSKTDGNPLARARVVIRDTKDPQKFESVITAEDGKFDFRGIPAGKYSLNGAKRGFITAAYDQHDQFSTAILTDAALAPAALTLPLS